MSKKEIATAAPAAATAIAPVQAALDFAGDAHVGFENADSESYAIPFLQILQSGSPQVKRSDGAYVKGAEEGMFFETVSRSLLEGGEGALVIPVYYERCYNEWAPRASGGGFRGKHTVSDVARMGVTRNEQGLDVLPNGNLITDTRNHYVLIVREDSYTPAICSFSSTQVKKSKRWMTLMDSLKLKDANGNLFTPPMFSHLYRVTTVPESNDKGSWFGWQIETHGVLTSAALYTAAKDLRAAILAGEVKAQDPASQTSGSGYDDDDIPL